jgi:anti-sigma regulatory factor (Ser/Thr protein kinase)
MRSFKESRPGEWIVATSQEMLQELFARLRSELAPAEQQGYDSSRLYLLLDELLSNVYRHGYQGRDGEPIGVRVRMQGERAHVVVRDLAPTFDTAGHALTRKAPPPESGARGGMGLFIISSMCESFEHRVPHEGGNAVYVVMKLPRRGAPTEAETREPSRVASRDAGE